MNTTLGHKTLLVPAQSAQKVTSRYKWLSLDLAEPSLGAPLVLPLSSTDTFILSSNNLGSIRGWAPYSPFDAENLVVTNLSAKSIITNFLSAISATFINRVTENQNVTGTLTVAGTLRVRDNLTADRAFFNYLSARDFDLGPGDIGNIYSKLVDSDVGTFRLLDAENLKFISLSGDGRNLNPVGELIFNREQRTARMFTIALPISGSNNFYFGASAGTFATSNANDNIFIGNQAGFINLSGDDNIFLGKYSGFRNLSSHNIYIGSNAGANNETGGDNVVIGKNSGATSNESFAVSGKNMVVIGNDNAINNGNNVVLGSNNNTGFNRDIIVLGHNKVTEYNGDVIIGNSTIKPATNYLALQPFNASLTAVANTMINNAYAGFGTNTVSSYNVFVGPGAGAQNTTGRGNVNVGPQAGQNNSTGINNVNIGTLTSSTANSGNYNIALGYNTTNNSYDNTIVFGRNAYADRDNRFIVASPTTQVEGTVYGTLSATTRLFSPRIDAFEMFTTSLTSLSHILQVFKTNVYVSTLSGLTSTDFLFLTGALEAGSLSARTLSGDGSAINPIGPFRYDRSKDNISLFQSSTRSITGGSGNILFGSSAAPVLQSGASNIIMGNNAGLIFNSGNSNVILGSSAGRFATVTSENVLIGREAGYNMTTGFTNTVIGTIAGFNLTTGQSNAFYGANAGRSTTTGSNNIAIGEYSLNNNTIGHNNIALGAGSGTTTNSLSNVVVLGTNATASASNQFIVGSWTHPVTGRIFGPLTVDSLSARTQVRTLSVFTSKLFVESFDVGSFNLDSFTATNIATQNLTANNAILSGDGYGLNPVGLLKFNRQNKNAGMFNLDLVPRGGSNNLAFGDNAGKGLYKGDANIYIGANAGSVSDVLSEAVSAVQVTNAGNFVIQANGYFVVSFLGSGTRPASAEVVPFLVQAGRWGVERIDVTDNGAGYTTTPAVSVRYFNSSGVLQNPDTQAIVNAVLHDTRADNTIVIGNSAQGAAFSNSLVLGSYAKATSDNSFVVGSEVQPYTSGVVNSPLDVRGHFSATTKSFLIDHPTKKGKKLQYGSLEGPELGVYCRGKTNKSTIKLPKVWQHLVHEDSITVQLTPMGKHQNLYIASCNNQQVHVGNVQGFYFYTIYAERKDVLKLKVEV